MLTLQILQDDIEHLLKLVNTENNSNNVNFNMSVYNIFHLSFTAPKL